jgi:hypothetical protein
MRSVVLVPPSVTKVTVCVPLGAAVMLVSRLKLLVLATLGLPATSVATALTPTLPCPKVVRSLLLSSTVTGVTPLPGTVLVTLPV